MISITAYRHLTLRRWGAAGAAVASVSSQACPTSERSIARSTSPAAPRPFYGAYATASPPTITASNTGAEGPDRAR
jgi:hypothetical protein